MQVNRYWPKNVLPLLSQCQKLIYTTNAIEGFNRQLRKVTKTRTVFPTDDSLFQDPVPCNEGYNGEMVWKATQLWSYYLPADDFVSGQDKR